MPTIIHDQVIHANYSIPEGRRGLSASVLVAGSPCGIGRSRPTPFQPLELTPRAYIPSAGLRSGFGVHIIGIYASYSTSEGLRGLLARVFFAFLPVVGMDVPGLPPAGHLGRHLVSRFTRVAFEMASVSIESVSMASSAQLKDGEGCRQACSFAVDRWGIGRSQPTPCWPLGLTALVSISAAGLRSGFAFEWI